MWIFQPEFWGQFFDVNFGRWISRGCIFQGASFAGKKTESKNSTREFGPKFGSPKFVSQNSALNSGSGGAKSPVQTFVSDFFAEEPPEPKTGTAWTVPSPNRNRTELNRGLVAHDCGYPLSRYTCRATRVAADFLDFIAFCRCSTGVALHPLKTLVSPPWPRRCRTEIWVWKGVALHGGVAGTVAGVALHCAIPDVSTETEEDLGVHNSKPVPTL